MQTTDQVAGEAREMLADRIEVAVFAQRLQGEDSITLTASFSQWKDVIAALRAQPERGVEEMRERVEAALTEWTRPSAIRLMIGETITAQEGRTANAVAAMLAAKVRSALPLHPAKDEGGGR